jgi:hypothetical protein
MVQSQTCHRCSEAHDCKRIYQSLGRAEGPSVVVKVLVAFALPIVVFLAALAGFGHLLRARLVDPYVTPAAFVLAVLLTAGSVAAGSTIVKRLEREQQHPERGEYD